MKIHISVEYKINRFRPHRLAAVLLSHTCNISRSATSPGSKGPAAFAPNEGRDRCEPRSPSPHSRSFLHLVNGEHGLLDCLEHSTVTTKNLLMINIYRGTTKGLPLSTDLDAASDTLLVG